MVLVVADWWVSCKPAVQRFCTAVHIKLLLLSSASCRRRGFWHPTLIRCLLLQQNRMQPSSNPRNPAKQPQRKPCGGLDMLIAEFLVTILACDCATVWWLVCRLEVPIPRGSWSRSRAFLPISPRASFTNARLESFERFARCALHYGSYYSILCEGEAQKPLLHPSVLRQWKLLLKVSRRIHDVSGTDCSRLFKGRETQPHAK